jgi:hypothetical protein
MADLHKRSGDPLRAPFVVTLWLLLALPTASAQDFCALTVRVKAEDGFPTGSIWVELLDSSGNVKLKKATDGSTLKICDFDFGPHSLRVGTNECLPVTISNLRVVIGKPVHLNVILNPCAYQEFRNACLLYLRVVDREGNPVPGAEISLRPIPAIPAKSDSFGRYQSLFGGSQDVLLTKEGFEPTKVHAQCKDKEELDIKVKMEHLK